MPIRIVKEKDRVFFMGLAATQANLIMWTNRKNRIGCQLTMYSAKKLAMTREADALALEYNKALNEKVLKWSNDGGASYHDLTYNTLMSPSSLNNYEPYMLTDFAGKVVVDDTYRKYAEMISPNGAPGGNYDACRSKILSDITGISEEDINAVEGNNDELKRLDKEIIDHLAQEPEVETTTADKAFQNLGNIPGDAVTCRTGEADTNKDATSGTTWSDIIDSLGGDNYVTYLYYDKKKIDNNDANNKVRNIINSLADAFSSFNYAEVTDDMINNAVEKTYSLFTSSYKYDSAMYHSEYRRETAKYADDYNTICKFRDKERVGKDQYTYAVSLSNIANVFLNYLLGDEEAQSQISTTTCPLIDMSSIIFTDAEDKKAHDEWQAEYDSMIEERSGIEEQSSLVLDAEEEKLINFYDAIFENIETNGWTYNEYIGDTEYLNDVLQNGMYNITKAEKGDDGSWVYDESCPTTCQNVYQVSDSGAENRATAEYEAKKRNLQRKEEAVDTKMQKLETEQNAINQMLESYRSIIDEKTENLNVFT